MKLERLSIDVPKSEARRDRIVSTVLSRVAVMRATDRAEAATAEPRSRVRLALGLAAVAAAAIAAIVVLLPARMHAPASSPSLVVTPVGGSSRFTVGDAMIDAGPDTSVEVQTDADGAVTLALARGSVECDVAPRAGRPPFRVIAGDVAVEVVGTRFTVARRPEVRVDVARGKVKVIAATGTSYVLPGESWPAMAPAPAPSVPAPAAPAPVATEPAPTPPPSAAPAAPPPQVVFKEAQRLRPHDPDKAALLYRTLANHADVWAALSLYDLAEMHGSAQLDAALRELDELDRRFPRAANLEDAAWLRIEILRKAGRTDDARRAASSYLRRFPSGTYLDQAAHVAAP
ncbi:MAG TPA: FecR family protein [Kofleriaceae bacterium]|nr:FecR family protein [Kofleriaceae bacterium]